MQIMLNDFIFSIFVSSVQTAFEEKYTRVWSEKK